MLSIAELTALKTQVESRREMRGIAVLTPEQALLIINQAIDDRKTINRWFGFLKLMAGRSSWSEQIQALLDDYLYGTEDEKVKKAAQQYLERTKLHNR